MAGEHPDEQTGQSGDFMSKPRWQRILIYLAGPAMNVVLSVTLIAFVFMDGIPEQAFQEIPAVIGAVAEESPAAAADLRADDRIVAVDGKAVSLWSDLAFAISISPDRPVTLEVERDGERRTTTVTPVKVERYEYGDIGIAPAFQPRISEIFVDTPADHAGFRSGDTLLAVDGQPVGSSRDFVDYVEARAGVSIAVTIRRAENQLVVDVVPADDGGKGRIGVAVGLYRKLPFGEAVVESMRYNVEIVHKSMQVLGKLFTRELAAKSALSGPIEIAAWSGRAAKQGWKQLLFTMGFLSISIGFMNLLPIPVLDGGHITILLFESLIRRDLSVVVKERVTQAGFMMLMVLMVVVLFFDLSKNLPALISGG